MDSSAAPRTLYVGNLPRDLENPETVLHDIFSTIGLVLSVRICRDINTQNSLGYAYVNYQSPGDAERALQQLNYYQLPITRPSGAADPADTEVTGPELRVLWSARDPTARKRGAGNIFVKGLDPKMSNKQLHEFFSRWGPVLSVNQAYDEASRTRRGYGFVHFQNEEDAKNAIAAVNGNTIEGQTLTAGVFIRRAEREKEAEKTFTTIYVKNVKSDASDDDIAKVVAPFGAVEAVFATIHPKFNSKFAIVTLKSHEDALNAIDKLNGTKSAICLPDTSLFVARLRKKSERKPTSHGLYQNEGRNLYVKHLPDDITEDRLRADFAPYGDIESISLQKLDGIFRGFAFVLFKTKESADAAMRQLHQKVIYGRPLYVSLAQRRDARHKMLGEQARNMLQPRMMYPPMMWPHMQHMFSQMMPHHMRIMPQYPPRRPPQQRVVNNIRPKTMMRPNVPPPPRGPAPRSVTHDLSSIVANMTPEERKNALGERLYSQILHIDKEQASKITGMLLEMETDEIIQVINNTQQLESKVQEAKAVLAAHEATSH